MTVANINDIATHTGLSNATISRYLNGKPYVSKEAQLAIDMAVRELGYRPNASARSLRSGRTGRVVMVLRDAYHPFYAALLAGACRAAASVGYDVLVQQNHAEGWHSDRLTQLVTTRGVDGVILTTDLDPWSEYQSALSGIPAVTCDQALSDQSLPGVFIEHYQSTIEGLSHLRERGARCIACVQAPPADPCSSSDIRSAAYHDFAAQNPDTQIELVSIEDDLVHSGYVMLDALVHRSTPVDAVFSGSDDVAAGLLIAARERGIAVPGQLRILGFDDQPIARTLEISTVRQPVRRMGERAFELVHSIIHGENRFGADRLRVPYRLMVRSTT
ncbi:MAG: LacI family transcriptional regulator [Spirochaetaceae bacterium]|nr:MAG: LacI family transcriptional regulator [Spirochaetaceae bacterium]